MCYTPKSSDVGKYGDDNHWHNEYPNVCTHAAEYCSDSRHYNTFGALHKSYFTFNVESFGACSYVANHYRANHSDKCHHASPSPTSCEQIVADAKQCT